MTLGPFADLPDDERARLEDIAVLRSWDAGQALYRQGDLADRMHVVQSGIVGVHFTGPDGRLRLVTLLGEDSLFGELALIGAARRSATIVALEDARTLSFGVDAVAAIRRRSRVVDEVVMGVLADTLQRLTAELIEARWTSQPERLRRVLLQLHRLYAPGPIRLTQQQLAELIGARRTTVSELLAADTAYVSTGRGSVTVEDPAGLREALNRDGGGAGR